VSGNLTHGPISSTTTTAAVCIVHLKIISLYDLAKIYKKLTNLVNKHPVTTTNQPEYEQIVE
jgi:hypothetical protein